MLAKRVIVVLCHDGRGNLLKPRSFSRPARPVGSLMQTCKLMASRGVDEIMLIDMLATEEGRVQDFDKLAEYCALFDVPVGVGGGIKTIDDVKRALDCGADKIVLRSQTHGYKFMASCVAEIGSSSVCLNIVNSGGRIYVLTMLDMAVDCGVGEIMVTNRHRDGTMTGYDLSGLQFTYTLPIPVIINGGCGSANDMHIALTNGADAVAASSLFLFTDVTPKDCAKYLSDKGHQVRTKNG